MRRATVTLPDDVAEAVEGYMRAQEARPALTAVMEAALREYLAERGYLRARGALRISAVRRGSGHKDVSRSHDRYLAAR